MTEQPEPSGRVFISYRRRETSPFAELIYLALVARLGQERVFKDVDSITIGEDFRDVLLTALAASSAMVVVIGPQWLATAEGGRRRIDNPDDVVRLEVSTALRQGMRVLPVLVGGARMPDRSQLPADLGALAWRQAVALRDDHISTDLRPLVEALVRMATTGGGYRADTTSVGSARSEAAPPDAPPRDPSGPAGPPANTPVRPASTPVTHTGRSVQDASASTASARSRGRPPEGGSTPDTRNQSVVASRTGTPPAAASPTRPTATSPPRAPAASPSTTPTAPAPVAPQAWGRRRIALVAAAASVVLVIAVVVAVTSFIGGQDGASGPTTRGPVATTGAKVGVILPETASSARWVGFDKPLLTQAMAAAGLQADIQNAQGDEQKFSTFADSMIASQVKVLVIASISSESGATVAAKAKAQGIPVIDYDRLNLGGTSDYYVSFDNMKVGELQGQGLADALKSKRGAQVIEIEGAPTDNNATLFHNGQENILKPLYASGALKLVESQPVPNWDNQTGGTIFEQILTKNGGKVDGVVAANDGLAGAIITVLQKNGLNGKVPVTGQDATSDGLRAILRGDQYMTVYKPIKEEADATAKLAAAMAKGDTAAADALATATSDDPKGNRKVKSVLLTPQSITKDNVKVVVDGGQVKASEICVAATQSACGQLGIQ